jgi:hypothetical protein
MTYEGVFNFDQRLLAELVAATELVEAKVAALPTPI